MLLLIIKFVLEILDNYVKYNLVCPRYIRETAGGKSSLVRSCKRNDLALEITRRYSLPACKKSSRNIFLKKNSLA